MSKPPKTPPHSDLDGVHEDRRDIIGTALQTGQDSADVERAEKESVGRPPRDTADDSAEERSH